MVFIAPTMSRHATPVWHIAKTRTTIETGGRGGGMEGGCKGADEFSRGRVKKVPLSGIKLHHPRPYAINTCH